MNPAINGSNSMVQDVTLKMDRGTRRLSAISSDHQMNESDMRAQEKKPTPIDLL
jgi:hypothetical protein